jgi:hypothetical protein
MKSLTLGLVVGMGLLGIGCSAEPDGPSAPAETEVTRVASSLERKLASPIAIPSDSAIGGSIDALVAARAATLTAKSALKLGANGQRCSIVRYEDGKGVEQMRREKCDKATDKLFTGNLVYEDENADGKVDHFSDLTAATEAAATYDLFDDDHDGKVDRMVEPAERITTPISLTDFAENVTITAGGKIASRTRDDRDHDGRFDVESVTATTSFRITTTQLNLP